MGPSGQYPTHLVLKTEKRPKELSVPNEQQHIKAYVNII